MQETVLVNKLPVIGEKIANFELAIFQNEQDKKVKLSDYAGKWLVLFFYPADFTFVCPTELEEMAEMYPTFQKINTEVISVSTDTVFVHKAWHDESPSIKKITFPMGADPTGNLCRELGVYIPSEGLALRGTFIIDPGGVLKAFEVHDNSIGRSAAELLRKVEAAQFVATNPGLVCPASWRPGGKTLKPGLELVGKL